MCPRTQSYQAVEPGFQIQTFLRYQLGTVQCPTGQSTACTAFCHPALEAARFHFHMPYWLHSHNPTQIQGERERPHLSLGRWQVTLQKSIWNRRQRCAYLYPKLLATLFYHVLCKLFFIFAPNLPAPTIYSLCL